MPSDITIAKLQGTADSESSYRKLLVDTDGKLLVAGSFTGGGVTEYTEGDTDTSITGIAMMGEGNSNTLLPLKLNSDQTLRIAIANIDNTSIQVGTGNAGGGTIRVAVASDTDWKPHIQDSAGNNIVLGQATMSNSLPVAIASNQSDIPVDSELPPAASLADATSNPTAPAVGSFGHAFNGTTWDRVRSLGDNSDAIATGTTGHVATMSQLLGFNGTTWDRLRSDTTNGLDVDVTRLPALVAGSAIIGKVGIDQTTPGTTNGVQINAALPAGTNAIGKLAANDGVDIGDVTINNAAGASAVNIQDGGNSITVDGTVTASIAAGATTIAKAEDSASADADVGVPAMAVRKATPANTSGTDGDYEMLQMSAGRLWTSATIDAALPAGTNAIGKLASNSGVTIGAVEIAASQTLATVTSLTQMNGQAIAMGTGVRTAGTQRVTIATDDVVPASQSGTWTVQPGNTANTTPWLVQNVPGTTGGLTKYRNTALSNTATAVKASAGGLYYIHVYNSNTTDCFLQIYDAAAGSVTVGTTTPDMTLCVPAGGVLDTPMDGSALGFSTAITIAATTTITGGTAPSTGFLVSMGYK